MKLNEMIDEIKNNSKMMLELTAQIAKSAAQGCAPDNEQMKQLAELGGKVEAMRTELARELGQDAEKTSALPLEELEALVVERELRLRMCAAMAGRIEKAAVLLRGLDTPCDAARPVGEIANDARTMLERGDADGVAELEREAQPYLDMYALVRDQAQAMRADAGLIGRIEKYYPQIAWYVRAQMSAAVGEAELENDDDAALDGLRTATSDESKMKFGGKSNNKMVLRADKQKQECNPADEANQGEACGAQSADPEPEKEQAEKVEEKPETLPEAPYADKKSIAEAVNPSEENVITLAQPAKGGAKLDAAARVLAAFDFSAEELEKTFNTPKRAEEQQSEIYEYITAALNAIIAGESEKTLAELANEYPEFDGLRRLMELVDSGDAGRQREMVLAMLRRAALQAYICDDIRRDAQRFLERNSPQDCKPHNINQAVMRRMLWRGTGSIACALEIISERRIADYAKVTQLYDKLMISGSNNGVQLSRFEMYATQLWREEAVNFKGVADKPGGAVVLNWLRLLNPALLIIGRWNMLVGTSGKPDHKK